MNAGNGGLEAPAWVNSDVLPRVEGRVRSVHMLAEDKVVVFSETHALFGEKKLMGGVRLFRVDFPPGFLVNGSRCPHCDRIIAQPVGKVARLAEPKAKRRKSSKR